MLLEKGEIVNAGNYLSKVDGKSISLDASTILLMMSLFHWKVNMGSSNIAPYKVSILWCSQPQLSS
jgi:hypothetical protein